MLLVLAVTVGTRVVAPSMARGDEIQRAIFSLVVNDVPKGDVVVVLRAGDILVATADLERAGLHGVAGRREALDGQTYVSLSSLAPAVTATLDEPAVALRLTARPELLGASIFDLRGARPAEIVYRADPSAFLNYAVEVRDLDRYAVFGEVGVSLGGAFLFGDVSRTDEGAIVRGLTNITYDDRERLTRWVLGDHVARSDPLGAALLVGGLQISREFALDPYFVGFPTVQLSGAVSTPSTAELYVNGVRLRRFDLPPGTFELKNLPAPAGSGTAQLVVHDAFGRQQVIVSPFYLSTGLLVPGLHDYSYSLGLRRNGFGVESWDYDRPGFLGRHRVGLTAALTAGLRLEAAGDLLSGGASLTAALPVGELDLAAAASREDDRSGAAGSVAYRYTGRRITAGAAVRALSDRYATLSLAGDDDRARVEMSAFAGARLGWLADLTVQYVRSDFRDRGVRDRVSALLTTRLGSRASLFLSAARLTREDGKSADEVFTLLSVFLGERTTAGVSLGARDGGGAASVEVHRSLPVGRGLGYRFRAGVDDDTAYGAGSVEYQSRYGRYAAAYENRGGSERSLLGVAGGVVAVGGSLFATRPVTGSFALLRVAGVQGVRGYLHNQEIGRTDARGDLLVPNLLPYYGNRLRIADEDVPLDFAVDATERTIATPFRGGAVVAFPVQPVRAVSGRLLIDGPPAIVPAFGQLTVTAPERRFDSPVGREGEFYLDGVPGGRHPAVIEHAGGRCAFVLEVPPATVPVLDLGTVRCPAGATP